ncbi:MAG: M48 family metallopeptidase, partial [Verrucomicrobiales bacterium]|nr:M48 family metallopeptidase [Verrucomicrobiales bacterium]
MEPRRLTGLRPQVYEHPSDGAALDALQNTAGLETVVRKLNEWGFERLIRVQLTGSYLRVTPDNFPDLHTLLVRSAEVLDLPKIPDLYLAPGGEINALTAGVEHPLIVLNSGAVELLSSEELAFVLGHELGHLKSGHVLYYQIAEFLPVVVGILGAATFGLGEVLSVGMQAALLRWRRMAELTADRAGLLAVQDASVAITTLAKLAGLPPKHYASFNTEDFIAQAREFEAMDADKLNLVAKWLST